MLRGLVATAVLVVVVGGGILLVNSRGPHGGHSVAGSAAPRPRVPASNAPRNAGVNVGATHPTKLLYRSGSGYARANAVASSANFTRANLAVGVRKAVSSAAGGGFTVTPTYIKPQAHPSPARSHQASPSIGRFKVGQLERCLTIVAGRRPVLLAEVARYVGNPAVIVVLKPTNNVLSVIVAGLSCGVSGGDVLKRLSVPQS